MGRKHASGSARAPVSPEGRAARRRASETRTDLFLFPAPARIFSSPQARARRAARGLLADCARVPVCEFRVNREPELRELDRDVRLDSGLFDARENSFVLAHLAFGLLAARHRLVEVVEGGRAADGVQVAYGADGRLDLFARDEARRHLLEGPELRREVFQSLLA